MTSDSYFFSAGLGLRNRGEAYRETRAACRLKAGGWEVSQDGLIGPVANNTLAYKGRGAIKYNK